MPNTTFRDISTSTTLDGICVKKLERSDVAGTLSAIPASIDNQWAPRSILGQIVDTGAMPSAWIDERDRQARAEFMRSLIDNEKIIINRAYILNSSAVRSQYIDDIDSRLYFQKLLENETILVNLIKEESPIQFPSFPIEDEERVKEIWTSICKSANFIPTIRFSWDNRQNDEDFDKYLYRPFLNKLLGLPSLDPVKACYDLGIDEKYAKMVMEYLFQLSIYVADKRKDDITVSRNGIYEDFIVVEGSNVAERYFKGDRMILALKEFSDLAYNINLSDSLGVISSSPKETLNRSALQEIDDDNPEGEDMDPDELARCFRQFSFDVLKESHRIPRLEYLNCEDVFMIRNSGAHSDYLHTLNSFMRTARRNFSSVIERDGSSDATAQDLIQSYEQVVQTVTQRSRRNRYSELEENWISNMTFRVETAGVSFELDVGSATLKLDGANVIKTLNNTVPYVVKCVIGSAEFADQSLGSAFELFRGYMKSPKEQLETFQQRIIENTEISLLKDETQENEAASARSDDKTKERMDAFIM